MRSWLLLALLLASAPVWTQDAARSPGLEPIPDGPPNAAREQSVPAPEVTIRQQGNQGSIEEYRAGGVLYMIKVNPAKGVPYYLVDTDGNGNLETRYNGLQSRMLIPSWVLLRW